MPRPVLRGALLAGLLLAAAAGAAAQEPSASCEAHATGDRVVFTLRLDHFLDDELRRLLELGMAGRLRVESVVVRKRLGLFEQTLATTAIERRLTSTRGSSALRVDGVALDTPPGGPLKLEPLALRLPALGARPGPLLLRITASLRIVTVSSLGKVAAWATESNQDAPSLLTRSLLAAVVEDLTRSADCACPVDAR